MESPLELSFRNMDSSEYAERLIRDRVLKLERLYDGITSCHVYVEAPPAQQRKGNHYEVRLEVRVPGTELAVGNQPGDVNAHDDINVAIRDSFDAMERQLKRWRQKARGEVKTHEGQLQGQIAEIDHQRDFGQILAADGRLVYFHRNSVVDGDFDELKARDTVELVVRSKESEIGPQASTVRPIGAMRFTGGRTAGGI